MRFLLFLFSLCTFCTLSAQHHCQSLQTADALHAQTQRLQANLRNINTSSGQARDVAYVPIKFHLVAKHDGSQRIQERLVLDHLCEINEDFAAADIQFFLAGNTFNYIDNTSLFDYENEDEAEIVMSHNRDSTALNVFIINHAGLVNTLLTGGFYDTNPAKDWIVMSDFLVDTTKQHLTHELGHFFSLIHTYHGWSMPQFEDAITSPYMAPVVHPFTTFETELADGSNCMQAGDMICDTPPDYHILTTDCEYDIVILDANGDTVHTDLTNYMSHGLDVCLVDEDFHFSPQQMQIMQADYNSSDRDYLRIEEQPALDDIVGQAQLIAPMDDATTQFYDHVVFEWEALQGATAYLLEVSRGPSFGASLTESYILSDTTIVLHHLGEDNRYYWRVRPYNAYMTCNEYSSVAAVFETSELALMSSTNTIDELNEFWLYPNPLHAQTDLNINIDANTAFEASFSLFDAQGRKIKENQLLNCRVGVNQTQLALSELEAGLYFVQLQTAKGQIVKKVLVQPK